MADQTITSTATDAEVIAALRIAAEGTEGWEQLGKVTEAILTAVPAMEDAEADETGGLELLLHLQRTGELRFEVGGN